MARRTVEEWNERYAGTDYTYGTEPNAFLGAAAVWIRPGRVLELAAGEGRNAVYLASLGHTVVAVDQSPVGLEKARRLAASRGVEIETVTADLADHEIPPDSFDAVVAIFCHLPPPLRRAVYRRAVDGLRPGGVFIVEAYTPRQLEFRTGGPPVRELLVTLDDLRADLAGLDLEIAREVERDVVEGRLHRGRAAVVQVLGVKPPGRL